MTPREELEALRRLAALEQKRGPARKGAGDFGGYLADRFMNAAYNTVGFAADLPAHVMNTDASRTNEQGRRVLPFVDPMSGAVSEATMSAPPMRVPTPFQGAANQAFFATTGRTEEDLIPQSGAERYGGRAAEFAGAGAPLAPFLGPAGALADVAIGGGQGLLYEGVKDITGSEGAAAATSLVAPLSVGSALTAGKRFLQGGQRGAQSAKRAIQEFAQVGATPSAAEATQAAPAMAAERVASQLPGSSFMAQKRGQRVQESMGAEVERIADRLGGGARTAEDAGEAIAQGLQGRASSYVETSLADVQRKYGALDAAIRTARPTGLTVDVRPTVQRLRQAITAPKGGEAVMGQGRSLANAELTRLADDFEELVKTTGGVIPYETAAQLRTRIGELADNFTAQAVGRDVKQFRNVWANLTGDIERAIVGIGSRQIVKLQNDAKRAYQLRQARLANIVDPLTRRLEGPGGEESLYKWAWSGGEVSNSRLQRLKDVLPSAAWRKVVAVTLRNMGLARAGEQALDSAFSFETFLTNWERFSRAGALNTMFQGKRSNSLLSRYYSDMERIAGMAARMRKVRQVGYNPSGTAPLAANLAAAGTATGAALTGNLPVFGMVMSAIGSGVATQALMTSPRFVRWLAEYGEFPLERVAVAIARLNAIANEETDPEAKAAMQALAQQLGSQQK